MTKEEVQLIVNNGKLLQELPPEILEEIGGLTPEYTTHLKQLNWLLMKLVRELHE